MGTCHCSRCRKLGTSTIVFVTREQFRLKSGAADIRTVEPRAPYKYARSFCRQCGTSLGEPLSGDESFPINAHCLDGDPGIRNSFQEFLSERPAWAAAGEGDRGRPDPDGPSAHPAGDESFGGALVPPRDTTS